MQKSRALSLLENTTTGSIGTVTIGAPTVISNTGTVDVPKKKSRFAKRKLESATCDVSPVLTAGAATVLRNRRERAKQLAVGTLKPSVKESLVNKFLAD